MTRLFARQTAVDLQEVSDEMAQSVSGGGSYRPSHAGGDVEVIPGLFVDPNPIQPGRTTNPGIVTWGINEN